MWPPWPHALDCLMPQHNCKTEHHIKVGIAFLLRCLKVPGLKLGQKIDFPGWCFWCRIHLWFRWLGVCRQSRWRHTEPSRPRWRVCVTMATLWQQQDGGYMLLWKRFLHLQQYSHRLKLFFFFFFFFCSFIQFFQENSEAEPPVQLRTLHTSNIPIRNSFSSYHSTLYVYC